MSAETARPGLAAAWRDVRSRGRCPRLIRVDAAQHTPHPLRRHRPVRGTADDVLGNPDIRGHDVDVVTDREASAEMLAQAGYREVEAASSGRLDQARIDESGLL